MKKRWVELVESELDAMRGTPAADETLRLIDLEVERRNNPYADIDERKASIEREHRLWLTTLYDRFRREDQEGTKGNESHK